MTPSRRPSFAVLAVACALVLTACGGSDPSANDATGESPAPAGSPTASRGTSPATPGRTDSPAAGESPGTTAGGTSGGGTTTEPGTAAESPAPAPGTYTYAQSGQTTRGKDFPSRGTLAVARAKPIAGGVEQQQTRRKIEEGDGDQVVYAFLRDQVVVTKVYRGSTWCTLEPALKVLMLPIRVGQQWTSHSKCKLSGDLTLTIDYTGSVLRREARRVGSTAVETFVLSTTVIFGLAGYTSTEKATTWLSPKYKLVVRSEETTEVSTGSSGRFTEQLLSLEPKE